VKNVAAMLHLQGEPETKKWLAEHGADNKKISEGKFFSSILDRFVYSVAIDMAKHCLNTHKLEIHVYDPNGWMKGAANSISGSAASSAGSSSSVASDGMISKKSTSKKRYVLRWEPKENFKYVSFEIRSNFYSNA
jgi:hypothetical protein